MESIHIFVLLVLCVLGFYLYKKQRKQKEREQGRDQAEVKVAMEDSRQVADTTDEHLWYFTNKYGERISNDQPIDYSTHLTHPCPICHEEGSRGRMLPWILYECLDSGNASFPCDSCGKWIKIPSEVFLEDLLMATRERLEKYIGRTPDNIRRKLAATCCLGNLWIKAEVQSYRN